MSEQKYIRVEDFDSFITHNLCDPVDGIKEQNAQLQKRKFTVEQFFDAMNRYADAHPITPADILAGCWVDVEADPPKPGTPCWVTDGDKGLELVIRQAWGWKCVASVHDLEGSITHWMPLPAAPKEDSHGE